MQVIVSGDFTGEQYTIDSLDFWTAFGWMIESGNDELMALPDSKEVYSKDWKGENGKQYDLTKRYFEDKVVTLAGYIIAETKADYWNKYKALWNLLKSPGTREIYSYELEQTFGAFYLKSPGVKRFTRLQDFPDKIAVKVDITFQVMFSDLTPPIGNFLPLALPFDL